MHRIEMAVDLVLETLRRHGKNVDGLEPELRAEAEALVQKLRDQGLSPYHAIRRTHDLLPRAVLPRYGIHPINEGLWFRVLYFITLGLLLLLELTWLDHGENLVTFLILTFFGLVGFWEGYIFLSEMLGTRIVDGVFRYRLRSTRIDQIQSLNWSPWWGYRFTLADGTKRNVRTLANSNFYFWKRLLRQLNKDVEIPARVKRRFDRFSSPQRADRLKKFLIGINLLGTAFLILILVQHLIIHRYYPFPLCFGVLLVCGINAIFFDLWFNRKSTLTWRYLYLLSLIPLGFGFEWMAVFRDQITYLVMLCLALAAGIASLAQSWGSPLPGKKFFKVAGLSMAVALLGPVAAGLAIPDQEQTIAVIDNAGFHCLTLDIRDRFLITVTKPMELDVKAQLHKIDLKTGAITRITLEHDFEWLVCGLSPDQEHLVCREGPEYGENRKIWIASTDDLHFSPVPTRPGAEFGFFSLDRPELWDPNGNKVILEEYEREKDQTIWEASRKYHLYDLNTGKLSLITERPRTHRFICWIDENHLMFEIQLPTDSGETGYQYRSLDLATGDESTLLEFPIGDLKSKYLNGAAKLLLVEKNDLLLSVWDLTQMKEYPLSFTLADLGTSGLSAYTRTSGHQLVMSISKDESTVGMARIDFQNDRYQTYPFDAKAARLSVHSSPDGKKVAYLMNAPSSLLDDYLGSYICVLNLDTGLTNKAANLDWAWLSNTDLVWAEDSATIFYTETLPPALFPTEWRMAMRKVIVSP